MNLLKTVAAISSMTMLSRITGLLRESLFARAFGASAYTDAFIIAYRIPNLLRRLFAEGAFSQAFVPILAEYKTQHGDQATKGLVDHVANSLIWATLLVTILGIVGSAGLLTLIASGLAPEAFDDAVLMTRIMFPYIICMSMAALAGGILNTWREFKIPAFAPVLLNVSQILAALFLVKYFAQPVYAMVVGVCVGGILQVAIQVPALVKIGMLPKLSFNPLSGLRDAGVRRMLARMGPAVFAVAAAQISLLINTSIAASLAAGSVSALQYADRLMEFPIGLLGVALGTVLLPSLSKANAEGDATEYSSLLDWGLRLTFLLAMPAAVGMAVLAEPLIATLFNYGKFTAAAVHASSLPLTAYAAGLLGIILVKTLAPAFYATQNVRTPVRIAMVVIVATQLLNGVFVFGMGMGVTGLALSIGVGACLNALLLFVGLRKRGIYVAQPGWFLFFVKLVIASAALGAVAWFAQGQFQWAGVNPWLRAGRLFAIIGAAAVAYFAVLAVLGFRFSHFKRRAR